MMPLWTLLLSKTPRTRSATAPLHLTPRVLGKIVHTIVSMKPRSVESEGSHADLSVPSIDCYATSHANSAERCKALNDKGSRCDVREHHGSECIALSEPTWFPTEATDKHVLGSLTIKSLFTYANEWKITTAHESIKQHRHEAIMRTACSSLCLENNGSNANASMPYAEHDRRGVQLACVGPTSYFLPLSAEIRRRQGAKSLRLTHEAHMCLSDNYRTS
jgi:hypothetical protein